MRTSLPLGPVLVLTLGLLAACRPRGHVEAYPREGHEEEAGETLGAGLAGVEEELGDGSEPGEGTGEGTADHFAVDGVLRSIPSAEAVEVTGPDGRRFRVALRTPLIGHYPCTGCHVRPIGQKVQALDQMHGPRPEHEGATRIDCQRCHDPRRPGGLRFDCAECHEREGTRDLMPSRTAHLTIELGHPGGYYRNCLTCHAPENPGLLTLRDGRKATLDEAYRLCQGCHFNEAESWANGAHGKRLGGWAGERTILSCTGCHNPHDPAFPVRRPVTFPKIARPGEGR